MNSNTPTLTAAACLSCATMGGFIPWDCQRPSRRRGLCGRCYQRALSQGLATRYPECGAVPLAADFTHYERQTFEGFPEGHTPILRDYPEQPALVAPLHPPLPAPDRWGHVVWFSRPKHDPIGQRLCDAETRYVEVEAA